MVYYNEFDKGAAAGLRELIRQGHIADGIVDERSILDVTVSDLSGFTQCHFFAGIGVWSHALRCAGVPDDYPVWTGSCPCQPFSVAGKGKGVDDERHLWPVFRDLIAQCRPPVLFGEQVASAAGRDWLSSVRTDLEALGYAVGAADLCAAGVGAPHIRQRLYFTGRMADAKRIGNMRGLGDGIGEEIQTYCGREENARADKIRNGSSVCGQPAAHAPDSLWRTPDWLYCRDGKWRPVESGTFPLAHGASARVGRLRGYGNAIVAPLAQAFIEASMEDF